MGIFQRVYNWFKERRIATTIITVLAILAFVFGYGIYFRPHLEISCGAVDMKVPDQYFFDRMMLSMMFKAPELINETVLPRLEEELRAFDFPSAKIPLVLAYVREGGLNAEDIVEVLGLREYEENILGFVVIRLSMSGMFDIGSEATRIPQGVLFFEIENNGHASAKNAHIQIILGGTFYDWDFYSNNSIANVELEGNIISIDLNSISPNSTTRGIVWYSKMSMPDEDEIGTRFEISQMEEPNQICITYDDGTVQKTFSEDDFYLAD